MVTSHVGTGTTFTLCLPRVAGMYRMDDVSEPEPLIDGHGTCVLVVEDNHDVGTFATQTLTELGYITVWAANAEQALAELAKDVNRFGVVFTDVVMPGAGARPYLDSNWPSCVRPKAKIGVMISEPTGIEGHVRHCRTAGAAT